MAACAEAVWRLGWTVTGMDAMRGQGVGAVLPLPPALAELSMAAPLAPDTLLALSLPPSLRTVGTTGLALGERHASGAADGAAADAPTEATALRLHPAAHSALCESIRRLHGRFAYLDLVTEMYVGFAGPAAVRRRHLASAGSVRPMGHMVRLGWLAALAPLPQLGLELAGLDLDEAAVVAGQLFSLKDLRLDCSYPLPSLPALAALRRLQRLHLNAAFWTLRQAQPAPLHPHPPHDSHGGPPGAQAPAHQAPTASAAANALTALCAAAPPCLRDVSLAPLGRAAARDAAMRAVVGVEGALPGVACGALRLWVGP